MSRLELPSVSDKQIIEKIKILDDKLIILYECKRLMESLRESGRLSALQFHTVLKTIGEYEAKTVNEILSLEDLVENSVYK